MKKKNKLKFLSESILLEESGLPMLNTIVIIMITVSILMFIIWSSYIVIEESVSVSAQLNINEETSAYEAIGIVGTRDISTISENAEVYFAIPGVTGRQDITGVLREINAEPKYDSVGNVYYNVYISLGLTDNLKKEIGTKLLKGMEGKLTIVTGTRSMLQYLLGSLYDNGRDAFNIK
jgi:hypothetical protein